MYAIPAECAFRIRKIAWFQTIRDQISSLTLNIQQSLFDLPKFDAGLILGQWSKGREIFYIEILRPQLVTASIYY